MFYSTLLVQGLIFYSKYLFGPWIDALQYLVGPAIGVLQYLVGPGIYVLQYLVGPGIDKSCIFRACRIGKSNAVLTLSGALSSAISTNTTHTIIVALLASTKYYN